MYSAFPHYPKPFPRFLFLSLVILFILTACSEPNDFPPPPSAMLSGNVTISPLAPGPVRLDTPTPETPAEAYTSRGLQILAEEDEYVIAEVKFKADGTYKLEISPGTYIVDLIPNGLDSAEGLPTTITLKPGETTTLDIMIDTGIR